MIEKPSGMRYNYSKENEGLVLLSNKTDKPKLTSRQLVIKMRDEKAFLSDMILKMMRRSICLTEIITCVRHAIEFPSRNSPQERTQENT